MNKIYFIIAVLLTSFSASSQNRFFYANLQGSQEVPPSGSSATGVVVVKYNSATKLLELWGDYKDLATAATASHIHSPAPVGTNAGVLVALTLSGGTSGTITGSVTLTPAQETDFYAGNMYVNVHNANFPAGEIRGQLMEATNGQSNFFTGRLQGAQEVPPNPSTATGMVHAILDRSLNMVYATGSFAGLTSAASAGHIHKAAPTVAGGVLIPLVFSAATGGVFHVTSTVLPADATEIANGNSYINIHSATYPGGEIRGQMIQEFSLRYLAGTLQSSQEVPPNLSTATGNVIVKYNVDTKLLELEGNYNGLAANITASHIHSPAAPGTNAAVLVSLSNTGGTSGTLSVSTTLTTPQETDLLNGLMYVNVHSITFPGGEIRAQLNPTSSNQTSYLKTALQGSQENPTNASLATGSATLLLDLVTNQLWLTGSFSGLSSAATAAHIHQATTGTNGSVVVTLTPTPATSGTVNGSAIVTATFANQVISGNSYINIHNTNFPAGEIRGQFGNLVLPVTLVYFNGFKKDNKIILQWETSNEINLQRFEVEQQDDVSGNWLLKEVVAANGTRNNGSYQVQDIPNDSKKPYLLYRLKMLDADGKVAYSSVIRIKYANAGAALSIANNPVINGRLSFTITGLPNIVNTAISIVDFSGKVVYNGSASSSQNNFVDVTRLSAGIYKLIIQINGATMQESFSKY